MINTVLGIDPGTKGGLALVHRDGRCLGLWKLPYMSVNKSSGGQKSYVDGVALAELLRGLPALPDQAWLEDVFSRPGEGHVGAFSFGEGKGTIKGVLAALGVPREDIAPSVWKGALGLSGIVDKKARKTAAIAKATKLFPSAPPKLVRLDGPAEALLIAGYGLLRR